MTIHLNFNFNLNVLFQFRDGASSGRSLDSPASCHTPSMVARSHLLRLITPARTRTLSASHLYCATTLRYYSMTRDFDHYKPHLLPVVPGAEQGPDGPYTEPDWTQNLDLSGATTFSKGVWGEKKLRVLVLYGSLRERCVRHLDPKPSRA
jgi:hypothetical protein